MPQQMVGLISGHRRLKHQNRKSEAHLEYDAQIQQHLFAHSTKSPDRNEGQPQPKHPCLRQPD